MFEQLCLLGIIYATPAIVPPHGQKLQSMVADHRICTVMAKNWWLSFPQTVAQNSALLAHSVRNTQTLERTDKSRPPSTLGGFLITIGEPSGKCGFTTLRKF